MANNLTLIQTPTFNATGGKFGGAFTGGVGTTPTNPLPTTGGFTVEALFSFAGGGGTYLILGSVDTFWVGMSGGVLQADFGLSTTQIGITSSVGVSAGYHHVALVCGTAGTTLFLDGAVVGMSASTFSGQGASFANPIGVRAFNGFMYGTFGWLGSVDEVAFWSGSRYTAAFTPPTAAYAGSETNLLALYHLDADGTDSSGVAPPGTVIASNNASIVYSPYNWQVLPGAATTWNPGAYFRTLFTGASCALNFDVSANVAPLSQIWWRVDNGPWTQAAVAATIACAIPSITTGNADVPYHRLEVIVKGMNSPAGLNRWVPPTTVEVRFTGLTLASGGAVLAPGKAALNILIYGDSITEGIRTLGETLGTPDVNDALFSWPTRLGELLGAEVGVVGFGGTGYGVTYGSVPVFPSSYALIASGVARTFAPAPDLVVINHGTNDGTNNIQAAAIQALNGILAVVSCKIAVLNPLPSATDNAYLVAAAAATNAPARSVFVSTAGFFDKTKGADGLQLHPSGPNATQLIAPKVAAALRPLLPGATATLLARWTH